MDKLEELKNKKKAYEGAVKILQAYKLKLLKKLKEKKDASNKDAGK